MNTKGKPPTFEELVAGIRTKKSLAQAKKRAEEERNAGQAKGCQELMLEADPLGLFYD